MTLPHAIFRLLGSTLLACVMFAGHAGAPSAQILDIEEEPEDEAQRVTGRLSIGVGVAKLAEDWYFAMQPGCNLRVSGLTIAREGQVFDEDQTHNLRFSFRVPLRFRLSDRDPKDDLGTFRTADWDEPIEFVRILRRVIYGAPYAGVYFSGGRLSDVRIGHRTIVDSYSNTLDLDHFQWGFHSAVNTVYGGGEVFVDNLGDPDLIGMRIYARPAAFVDRTSYWSRFAVGMSLIADTDAPVALEYDELGRDYRIEGGEFVELASTTAGIWGLDVEFALEANERVTMTPYMDANVHLGSGAGWHIGTFFGVNIQDQAVLDLRAEYRLLGPGYLPGYFSPLYEVERWSYLQFNERERELPKAAWIRDSRLRLRSGYLAEIGLNVRSKLYLSGTWEDAGGIDNNSAWIQVRMPAWNRVQFGALWANTRFDGARELFDLQHSLATFEVRVLTVKFLYVEAQVNRRWQLVETRPGFGRFRPVDDFAFGAGLTWGF
jgi:hypothetical protein